MCADLSVDFGLREARHEPCHECITINAPLLFIVISAVISVQSNASDKSMRQILKIVLKIILSLKILGKLFYGYSSF